LSHNRSSTIMNVLPSHDIHQALSWLTTRAFEDLRLPVLAVVMAGGEHRMLLRHLEEECREIDRASGKLLILSLGTSRNAPRLWNPHWRYSRRSELVRRIESILERSNSHKLGTVWGNFAEAAVQLLNLEPSCLPAVYLRFSAFGASGGESASVVVPMPKSRPELVSRFLKKLSFAAEDHDDGLMSLDSFFVAQGLAAWVIPKSTQSAIDEAFRADCRLMHERGPGRRDLNLFPRAMADKQPSLDFEEQCRVRMVMDTAINWGSGYGTSHHEIASSVGSFLENGERRGTKFYRPDLNAAIRLSAIAYDLGDYGTVVRNIVATIEALFNASLLHLLRGTKGVALPRYLDHVDPSKGRIEVLGVPLNHPRHDLIGLAKANADECMTPWLAPTLGRGTDAFLKCSEQISLPPVVLEACQEIATLMGVMAHIRNPAAHGEVIQREAADEAWRLLELLTLSGQANAMASLRSGFVNWPQHDFSPFAKVVSDPQHVLGKRISESFEADKRLKESVVILAQRKEKLELHRAQLKELESIAHEPNANIDSLLNHPIFRKAQCFLPNWEALSADRTALRAPDRLAKEIARGASKRFTTDSTNDRDQLGEISRLMKPEPETLRNSEDVERVIQDIELILQAGVVYPRTGVDWRTNVRRDFERWLSSVAIQSQVLSRQTSEFIAQTVGEWLDVLSAYVRQAEVDVREATQIEAEARLLYDCARERLRHARRGLPLDCRCGSHE
jgi:hypothetical protein